MIKLITDVLLPKINNSGAIVKDNNAFSRDTQILSDIVSSKEIVVPESISFRSQGKTTVLNFDEEQTLNTEKRKWNIRWQSPPSNISATINRDGVLKWLSNM